MIGMCCAARQLQKPGIISPYILRVCVLTACLPNEGSDQEPSLAVRNLTGRCLAHGHVFLRESLVACSKTVLLPASLNSLSSLPDHAIYTVFRPESFSFSITSTQ